jgi:uncharacterized protein YjiS (DUF1127 family)
LGYFTNHEIRFGEGAMTTITNQTRRIADWLSHSRPRTELAALSDRALQDIGLMRYRPVSETCKPFWMA